MKRYFRTIILISLAAIAFAGCNIEKIEEPQALRKINLSVVAETSSPSTKASLTPFGNENEFITRWDKDDEIGVFALYDDSIQHLASMCWDPYDYVFNSGYIDIDETMPASVDLFAVYPEFDFDSGTEDEDWEIDFGELRYQDGSGYNCYYDVMLSQTVSASIEENMSVVLPMERLTSVMYFHLTSDIYEAIDYATLEAEDGYIAGKFLLSGPGFSDEDVQYEIMTTDEYIFGYNADSHSITLRAYDLYTNDFTLWFNVLPANYYSSMTLTIHTKNGKSAVLKNGSSGSLTAGDIYKVSQKVKFYYDDDPHIYFETPWYLECNGGDSMIGFTAENVDGEITATCDGVVITSASVSEDGIVEFTYSSNDSGSFREGSIIISGDGTEATVTFVQYPEIPYSDYENIMTVSEAVGIISGFPDGFSLGDDFWVTGVVTQAQRSFNAGVLTYSIADPAHPEKELKIYRCVFFNGWDFWNVNQILPGDVVVVSGRPSHTNGVYGLLDPIVHTLNDATVAVQYLDLFDGYKTRFTVGEPFSYGDTQIGARWTNYDYEYLTADQVEFVIPDMSTPGKKTVTVKYRRAEASYTITVVSP